MPAPPDVDKLIKAYQSEIDTDTQFKLAEHANKLLEECDNHSERSRAKLEACFSNPSSSKSAAALFKASGSKNISRAALELALKVKDNILGPDGPVTHREGHPMALKIRPLEDRVVVKQIEAEEKTAGGIVLPDTAKEKPQRGKVLAVGPGKMLDSGERSPIGVKDGDEVLFGKYSGTDIKVDGEEVKILRETDILAKIL